MARSKSRSSHKSTTRILNLVKSRGVEKDWNYDVAVQAAAVKPVASPPAAVDLRAAWWAVGDQEDTGSCVGWASTDGVMRYHLVKAGKIAQGELLSPRFTWMASKETDQFVSRPETMIEGVGTSLKAAMDICRKYGVVPDKLLPFHVNTKMYTGDEDKFFAQAAQRKAASYYNLGKDLPKWRSWLASHGPLLVGLDVDATWMNASAAKSKLDTYQAKTASGGHAVCVVGYTKDKRFIIRNSWGTGWGDKGFVYASEAYIKAGFFNESYGVTL
ncbi:MAG: C1 family peptidase [Gammaproteobacteria bacterium]|nr:C1 family peptidase [Gammaproteobacteria bacterium]